jgi:DnaJ-class molecular chaperone
VAGYRNPAAIVNRKNEQYGKYIFLCTISLMTKEEQKKICDVCGGIGQISFFKGVSRFLLSTEECSECAGTGLKLPEDNDHKENPDSTKRKKKKGT